MPAPVRPPPTAVKKPAPSAPVPAAEESSPSRLAWFLGWVVVPGVVFGGIFTGGLVVGAHYHDGIVTRAIVWCAGLFGG